MTDGRGADCVIVAAASEEVFPQAFCLVRRGGVIIVFAARKGAETSLRLERLFHGEISILPSYSSTEVETKVALEMIRSKKVKVFDLITHRYTLSK